MNKKTGFTLAEVLITLVIIGVIAAMTVPTLMNNTSSQEYRTGVKKAISMLNQAVTMQYALQGETMADFTTAALMRDNVFTKRLNVINTTTSAIGGVATDATIYTADGMKFGFRDVTSGCTDTVKCGTILIDVNGDRKPNKPTTDANSPKDVYAAQIFSQRIVPFSQTAAPAYKTQEVMFESGQGSSF